MAGLRTFFSTFMNTANTSAEAVNTTVETFAVAVQSTSEIANEWIKIQNARRVALKDVRISEAAREIITEQVKESKKVKTFLDKYKEDLGYKTTTKDDKGNEVTVEVTARDVFLDLVNSLEKATK